MNMIRKISKITIFAILSILLLLAFIFGLNVEDNFATADASYYKLSYGEYKPGYKNATTGAETIVYIDDYAYTSLIKITYDTIKVKNQTVAEGLSTSNGKFVGNVEYIQEYVEINKDQLVKYEANDDAHKYGFAVKTYENCAYSFTLHYQISPQDEIVKVYQNILVCLIVDNKAPAVNVNSLMWEDSKCRIKTAITDEFDYTAVSGLKMATVFKRKNTSTDENDYEQVESKTFSSSEASYTFDVDFGNYNYYIELTDNVGNTSGKVLVAELTAYNEALEKNVRNAINYMSTHEFNNEVYNDLCSEYGEYLLVISDESSTEEQKAQSAKDLQSQYDVYYRLKKAYDNGERIVNLSVNGDCLGEILISNEQEALKSHNTGESVNITLNVNKSDYNANIDIESIEKAGITDADTKYKINIVTTFGESTIGQSFVFSSPLIIRVQLDDYEKIGAVQTVYHTNGDKDYYQCTVVGYTDGTVSISVPFSAGIVELFTYNEQPKNYYWLFSFTAIPLIIGVILLVYARKRIKALPKNTDDNQKADDNNQKNDDNNQKVDKK